MTGVFDSGVGGLCALRELYRRRPEEDYLYFADTAHLPYGEKTPDEICRYTRAALEFLCQKGATRILIGCGTASSVALPVVADRFSVPVFGIIDAACTAAVRGCRKGGKIAVLATAATVKSGVFPRVLSGLSPGVSVRAIGCPAFVPLAECGADAKETRRAAEEYLAPLRSFAPDTVILGCTHFPLLSAAIREALPGVCLIDGAKEAAAALTARIPEKSGHTGTVRFFVSADPAGFSARAACLLPSFPSVRAEYVRPTEKE